MSDLTVSEYGEVQKFCSQIENLTGIVDAINRYYELLNWIFSTLHKIATPTATANIFRIKQTGDSES